MNENKNDYNGNNISNNTSNLNDNSNISTNIHSSDNTNTYIDTGTTSTNSMQTSTYNIPNESPINQTNINSNVSVTSPNEDKNIQTSSVNNLSPNKTKLIKILIILFLAILIISGIIIFIISPQKSSQNKKGKTNALDGKDTEITKESVVKVFGDYLDDFKALTKDGSFYVYNKKDKKFEKDDSPKGMKDEQHNFYLGNDESIYLNYEPFLIANNSNELYDEGFVKIFSDSKIKKMSIAQAQRCGLFLDENNDVFAYNLLLDKQDNEEFCGFGKVYNFDLILKNVKDIFSDFSLNGYVDQNDTLYVKHKNNTDYKEILKDVKEVNWPYVITKDNSIYHIKTEGGNIYDSNFFELKLEKLDNKAEKFLENSSKKGAYIYDNKLFLDRYNSNSKFMTFIDMKIGYINIAKASEIKEIIYYDNSVDYELYNILILLDNSNKIQVYKETEKVATYSYDLDGLEKALQYINK